MAQKKKPQNKWIWGAVVIVALLFGGQTLSNIEDKSFSTLVEDTVTNIFSDEKTVKSNASSADDLLAIQWDHNPEHMVVELNNNQPTFTQEELAVPSADNGFYQTLSPLDQLNRVGVADAMLVDTAMPTEKRDERLTVDPTGWKNKQYTATNDEGKQVKLSLYNRGHLIGYQFTGLNSEPKNLATMTRVTNAPVMVKYENEIAAYLKETGNHVRYRVTPVFKDEELVARGFQLEAQSIETNDIQYNLYLLNVQEGVNINYQDGSSVIGQEQTY
ncbi:MAG: DNA/RNA non-specific endonuclease [Enterococcus sp.]